MQNAFSNNFYIHSIMGGDVMLRSNLFREITIL